MIWKRRRECGAFFFGEWGELDERLFIPSCDVKKKCIFAFGKEDDYEHRND